MNPLVKLFLYLVVLAIVHVLIGIAPKISQGWKQGLQFVLYLIAALLVISYLLGLAGVDVPVRFP